MARVTAEDCVINIPNRFELVMLAAQRARNISAGAELTVERNNDKNPVVALREIAENTIDLTEIEDSLVKGLQKHVEMDEPEEDEIDFDAIQQESVGDTEEPAVKAEGTILANNEEIGGQEEDDQEAPEAPVEVPVEAPVEDAGEDAEPTET